jgi:hypothetical protein
LIERCGNCLDYYNKGYQDAKTQDEKFDTILTAYDVKEMLITESKLEGHWHIEVQVPYGTNAFTGNRLWLDSINTLVESCGVKIISLRFKLKMNVAGYQFALREG